MLARRSHSRIVNLARPSLSALTQARTRNMSIIQNSSRPAQWKAAAPTPPTQTTTFSLQLSLPKLPLPEFDRTISKLKGSLKALARDGTEWSTAERRIDEFAKSELGKRLHGRLEQRQRETEHWLEEFWDDAGYLKYRDTIMVNVSYYYGFKTLSHLPQSQTHRAAAITRSALLQRRDLKQGKTPVDMNRTQPLCMDTWRWMFDCCRIPGLDGTDWSITGTKSEDDGNAGHIAVFRNGRLWKVDINNNGRLLSTSELERQFEMICEQSRGTYPHIGTLTSNDRDLWAKDFATLRDTSAQNATNLETVATAAFVVCLDSSAPTTRPEQSMLCFHGGRHGEELQNRWMDKPAQFIIFANGEAGYMGEHSVMDGTPSVTMCDRVLSNLWQDDFDHGSKNAPGSELIAPRPLDWDLTPDLISSIEVATRAAETIISQQELSMLTIPYGKDEIKRIGFSPDAWAQMIIQLAYHRLVKGKREGGTYEAASTRGFHKGRTETIRIVTQEAIRWCNAMVAGDQGTEANKALFEAACKRQGEDAKEAGKAMGIDRHLFGMKNVLQQGETLPELFSDPVYVRGSTWILSTSAIFSPHFTRGYGWGQVVPNGFGVAYMTGFPDRLEFTVTSKKAVPNAAFVKELDRAARDVRGLFTGDTSASPSTKSKL
ncbi:Carnitine O-acetyltransferase mitochondrial [Tulasnella sp. JGI-2019a]|nr:Carnitine O-acetyltransferase mitochondrial [Tulasnella sp. JGI-2019a]